MSTLRLEVVTPEKTIVNEEVEMVLCPGEAGEFGVLPNHASILSAIKIGALVYRANGKDETMFVSGGFVDVNGNTCSLLAETAELARDIDEMRAREAHERARRRLEEKKEELDVLRAEAALQRAIMRLKILGQNI